MSFTNESRKKATKWPFWLLVYKVTNPGSGSSGKSVNAVVSIYWFLLLCSRCSYPRDGSRSESCFGLRLPCCPLCYSLPCRNHFIPSNNTLFLICSWWRWGLRSPVQDSFLVVSFLSDFTAIFLFNQSHQQHGYITTL